MIVGLERIVAPVAEPVSLEEIKAQARVDDGGEDALLTGLIVAAREWVELYTGRAVMTQTWRLWLQQWPIDRAFVEVPRMPLQSVSQVMLYAADETSSVWSSAAYSVDQAAGRMWLRDGQAWPLAGRAMRGISVDFVAGYADSAHVPEAIKLAIRQLVTHWFEQRGEAGEMLREIPFGVAALLAAYRKVSL